MKFRYILLFVFGLLGHNIAVAAPFAYITNVSSNNVSVIDTATNTVVATVGVGLSPAAFGLFIGPAPISLDQVSLPYVLPLAAFGFGLLILLGRRQRRQRG